jgi:hypothetical protein
MSTNGHIVLAYIAWYARGIFVHFQDKKKSCPLTKAGAHLKHAPSERDACMSRRRTMTQNQTKSRHFLYQQACIGVEKHMHSRDA